MRTMICAAVASLMLVAALSSGVDARPAYKSAFDKKYPDVTKTKKTSCAVCHPVKSKKVRNDYGDALGKVVAKNEKDKEKIAEALGKIEKEKSKSEDEGKKGKTFGEILKDGKWPGDK